MGQIVRSRISSTAPPGETDRTVNDGVENILGHEAFPHAVCLLASGLFDTHKLAPRAAALFATQQRWLLSHAALAHHFQPFDGVERGVSRRRLGLLGPHLGIASRNTSYAVFDEATQYGVLDLMEEHVAHRETLAIPSANALSLIGLWYSQHLAALDLLDGGTRQSRFQMRSDMLLPRMQPIVARGLLSSPRLRAPGPLYTIFTWSDSGGWLMDRLIAGIDWRGSEGQDRYLTDISSITFLAESAKLSRSHTSRKLSEAQSIGGLGWTGRAGRSPLWISHGFYAEYAEFQARKLLILDGALTDAAAIEGPDHGAGDYRS